MLVVGHQPTLGEVAARLIEGREASWDLGTGAACWLQARPRKDGREAILLLSIDQAILERDGPAV